MSLKALVPILLGLALLAQHKAFDLQDATTIPGFSFTGGLFGKMTMRATSGTLDGYDAIINTTEWRPINTNSNSSKAITQKVTLPDLTVLYTKTDARKGWIRATGKVTANIGPSILNLTLRASEATVNNRAECRLRFGFAVTELDLELDLDALGFVGFLYKSNRVVMEKLKTVVSESLRKFVPNRLSYLVEQGLSNRQNLTVICTELFRSNATNFPEPEFF